MDSRQPRNGVYIFNPNVRHNLNSPVAAGVEMSPYIMFSATNYKFLGGADGALAYKKANTVKSDVDAEEDVKIGEENLTAAQLIDKQKSQNKSNDDLEKEAGEALQKAGAIESSMEALQDKLRNSKKKILNSLVLPLQGGMLEQLSAQWGNQNNYRLGVGINLRNIASEGTLSSMAVITKRYILNDLINSSFKDLWKMGLHSSGQAYNEYADVVYSNPENRSFRFSWDLYPSNEAEANTIKAIMFLFKYYMSPETDTGLTIKYPAMWEIEMVAPDLVNGGKKNLMYTSYCACRNVSINYDVNGSVVFHKDGEPVKNHLEVEFLELTYQTRNFLKFAADIQGVDIWSKQ